MGRWAPTWREIRKLHEVSVGSEWRFWPPRLVAELRLTQQRRDTTIRVAERMWVYTIGSLDRFRGVNLPGEHQCARNDLLEESS